MNKIERISLKTVADRMSAKVMKGIIGGFGDNGGYGGDGGCGGIYVLLSYHVSVLTSL
jgi:hypothetical protein